MPRSTETAAVSATLRSSVQSASAISADASATSHTPASDPVVPPASVVSVDASEQRALVDVFNRAQFGIILAAPLSPPAMTNDYARLLIDARDGLFVGNHGLEALRTAQTRALREAVERASRRTLDGCVTLQLPRPDARRSLVVHIPAIDSHAEAGLATIFVCDPTQAPRVDPAVLCRLFAFTKAEATLAILLMSGKSLEETAYALFVSIHTVRTHLKRMLLKTDTGRQAELLRLLLSCSAHIRLD